jgi:3-methylfumaryl-CoA hydratase
MTENLQSWIGKSEQRSDYITAAPLAAMSATLDREDPEPKPGAVLPPTWHWLFFLPRDPQSQLGPDGLARKGGFMPPVSLPRRMWAGNRLRFHAPLRVGDSVNRKSSIVRVEQKSGRTGALVFVTVRHEIHNSAGPALTEEHDVVYRAQPQPGDTPPRTTSTPPDGAQWSRKIRPDDVLLFRYSALTFNGHRIHYDRRYAMEVEGYPGLVVHGPLIATLLADLLRRSLPDAVPAAIEFRSVAPLFDSDPFDVCGKLDASGSVQLWAVDSRNSLAMTATASLG